MSLTELFLIAALSVPSVSFTYGTPLLASTNRTSFANLLLPQDRTSRAEKFNVHKILVVGGDPNRVQVLRNFGLSVFGAFTQDWPYITRFHSIMNIQHLAFSYETFNLLIFLHPNHTYENAYNWLIEITPLVEQGGYLAFNDDQYPNWVPLMALWAWPQLPTRFEGLAVFQKPINGGTGVHHGLGASA